MAKTRTTLTIDEDVLRAVKVRAARTGKGDGEVIEDALRRDLGLDLLDRLWARNDLTENEAVELAVEAQHATRRRPSGARVGRPTPSGAGRRDTGVLTRAVPRASRQCALIGLRSWAELRPCPEYYRDPHA